MRPLVSHGRGVGLARAQSGVSLVELMVALTMGLFVVGGAASIYLANRSTFATVENVARVEENARFAAELLARDIREAGNSPCGGAMSTSNLVSTSTSPNWAAWDNGLLGNPMGTQDTLAVSVASPTDKTARVTSPATDSLLIWSATSGSTPVRVTSHTAGNTGTFITATAPEYKVGDVLVACDGRLLFTFKVVSVSSTPPYTLTYTGGAALALYFSRVTTSFTTGGFISPLSTHLWYVGGSSELLSANALRRITLKEDGTFDSNDNAEIVTGVSNFQVKYLVGDTTGTPDPAAAYQTASSVLNWANVIAVQPTLTLTSLDKINPAGSAPSVFSYQLPLTIGIRNRLQP